MEKQGQNEYGQISIAGTKYLVVKIVILMSLILALLQYMHFQACVIVLKVENSNNGLVTTQKL